MANVLSKLTTRLQKTGIIPKLKQIVFATLVNFRFLTGISIELSYIQRLWKIIIIRFKTCIIRLNSFMTEVPII